MSHYDVEGARARRLRVTSTLSRKRRDEHVRRTHYDRTTGVVRPGCACELADTYFAKKSAFGCRCRKRVHGAPKRSHGICKNDRRHHVFGWRHEARALATEARVGRLSGTGSCPGVMSTMRGASSMLYSPASSSGNALRRAAASATFSSCPRTRSPHISFGASVLRPAVA